MKKAMLLIEIAARRNLDINRPRGNRDKPRAKQGHERLPRETRANPRFEIGVQRL
jgi:hypothetical protein